MTTPIPEDFFTLAIPLREGVQNNQMIIPEPQRRAGDTAFLVAVPAGLHTIQMLWRGTATPIYVILTDGTPNGRTLAVLPGGAESRPVTVQVVVPPGGAHIRFQQQLPVTAEKAATPPNTLGVTFILNPART